MMDFVQQPKKKQKTAPVRQAKKKKKAAPVQIATVTDEEESKHDCIDVDNGQRPTKRQRLISSQTQSDNDPAVIIPVLSPAVNPPRSLPRVGISSSSSQLPLSGSSASQAVDLSAVRDSPPASSSSSSSSSASASSSSSAMVLSSSSSEAAIFNRPR